MGELSEREIQKSALKILRAAPQISWVRQSDYRRSAWKEGTDGFPDLSGMLRGGRAFVIEFKKPGGKLSEKQKQFLQTNTNDGGISLVFYSVEETMEWITSLQFGTSKT